MAHNNHLKGAAEKLRGWRSARGWSQEQLGTLLEIGGAQVSHLENGSRTPSLDLAARIERLTEGLISASSWVPQSDLSEVSR